MAVLDTLPGVEVAITVNGGQLQEYTEPDAQDEEGVVTKYIEAQTGVNFAFSVRIPKGFRYKGEILSIRSFVDGSIIDHSLCLKESTQKRLFRVVVGKVVSGNGSSGKLKFNMLGKQSYLNCQILITFGLLTRAAIHDGRTSTDESKSAKNMGTLVVEIAHHILSGSVTRGYPGYALKHSIESVSEKTLKGQSVSHSVGYNSAISAQNMSKSNF